MRKKVWLGFPVCLVSLLVAGGIIAQETPCISAGGYHSFSVDKTGVLSGWGANSDGQIGDGTTSLTSTPTQVNSTRGLIGLSAGLSHTLAVSSDGRVFAWGDNQYGQLGLGTTTDTNSPTEISELKAIRSVSAGYYHSLALAADGRVWAWGNNSISGGGQLGDGTTTDRHSPVLVSDLSNVIAIAAFDYHSLALKRDGSVWGWGQNGYGELGDGTTTASTTPVKVASLADIIAVAGGNRHSMALQADGELWTWGRNSSGQLGDGTTTDRILPSNSNRLTNVKSIAGMQDHCACIDSDGTAWGWGNNEYGQVGDGSTDNPNKPEQVSDISGVKKVSCGHSHSLFAQADGTVWSCGRNNFGQLGHGSLANTNAPVQISLLYAGGVAMSPSLIACGRQHSLLLRSDGIVWGWGDNTYGQLALQTDATGTNLPWDIKGVSNAVSVVGGGSGYRSMVLKADGTVWCWGNNTHGQLGDGTTTDTNVPVQVTGLTGVVAVAGGYGFSFALKNDGTVWGWGDNSSSGGGQLGDGSTSDRYTPVQVSITGVIAIAGWDYHALALKSDGTVWAWGQNTYGELGDGTTAAKTTPTQVTGLSNIVAVAGGERHSVALCGDGTVWTWGRNNLGQLGDGTTTDRTTPVQVSNLTDIKAIVGSAYHTLALKGDGNIWTWGDNTYGQLGDGTMTNSSTPVLITKISNVRTIVAGYWHCMAEKSDGTLWAWGRNNYGQIGDGTTTDRDQPVQVGVGAASGLSASDGYYFDKVALTWTAGSNATYYQVWRNVSNDVLSATLISSTTRTSYDDTTVSAGTNYYYWIRAYNSSFVARYTDNGELGFLASGEKVPVYRLYSYGSAESTYEHLWTTSETEMQVLDSWPSWQYEGIAWYGHTNAVSNSVPLYRLYAASVKQHHYTIDATEYGVLDGDGTWVGEGIQYYVYSTNSVYGLYPAYRFYHSGLALHHFTISTTERDAITNNPSWGYVYEGVGYYVFATNTESIALNSPDSPGLAPGSRQNLGNSAAMSAQPGSDHDVLSSGTRPARARLHNGLWRLPRRNGSFLMWHEAQEGYIRVDEDYDGDKSTELALYEVNTGDWFIWKPSGEMLVAGENWGSHQMLPVPGDFSGNSVADMAVYCMNSGEWFIRSVSGNVILLGDIWGGEGFLPVSIDFDGDGINDLAVLQADTGEYHVKTTDGSILTE